MNRMDIIEESGRDTVRLQKEFPKVPKQVHLRVLYSLEQLDEKRSVDEDGSPAAKIRRISGWGKGNVWGTKRGVVLAAVLAAVLGTTALAAEYFQWNERAVEDFHGLSQKQQDRFAALGVAAGQEGTATVGGITVTALQTVSDKSTIYILMKVTSQEPLIGGMGFCHYRLLTEDGEEMPLGESGNSCYWDNGKTDGSLSTEGYLTLTFYSTSVTFDCDRLILRLTDYTADDYFWEDNTIKGQWDVPISLNPESARSLEKTCSTEQEAVVDGVPIVVKDVTLLPLSLEMHFAGPGERSQWDRKTFFYGIEYADGSIYEVNRYINWSMGQSDDGSWTLEVNFTGDLIDVEKAAAVLLGEGGTARIEIGSGDE